MWLTGLDRFGVPTPVAKVPTTYSQEEADRIAAMLGGIQAQSALTLPADVELSYDLDAGRVEPARAYVTAIEYEDRQIARAILGQELTSSGDSGGGSHALGDIHAGVQDDWIQALRRDLSDQPLAQLARAITRYSVGPDAPAPAIRFPNLSASDLRVRRELVEKMVTGGVVAAGEGWIRRYLGLPAAEGAR
jgi:phage gp29-like protein